MLASAAGPIINNLESRAPVRGLAPGGGRPADPRARTDARKGSWAAEARAKSDALEARILASEKNAKR